MKGKWSVARLLGHLQDLTCLDCYRAPFRLIDSRIARQERNQTRDLLEFCTKAWQNYGALSDEQVRVAMAKLCVALIPFSLEEIAQWLNMRSGRFVYEFHFSLFCYFDEIQNSKRLQPYRARVLSLTEDYLLNIRTENAQAAWMAADLLGDHWKLSKSLPILIKVIRQGKHQAGRNAARHGLVQARDRVRGEARRNIVKILEAIS